MRAAKISLAIASGVLLYGNVASAVNSTESLKSETSTIAKNLMSLYTTNLTTTGVLPSPYSWSESASLFSTMINYAFYTNDTTYNPTISTGLSSQIGTNNDFSPTTESSTETNSDQALWALACLTAVETNFQNPSDSNGIGWLGFAEKVWTEQSTRWNASVSGCKGGLGTSIAGDSGDSVGRDGLSTGLFFALSGRLARYTGNATFESVAETVYEWAIGEGLVGSGGQVFEGFSSGNACGDVEVDEVLWSANAGAFLLGAAHMFNATNGATTWKQRLTTLLTSTLKTFTPDGDGIIIEIACERQANCTTPQLSYKSILASSLLDTLTLAPHTAATITPVLQSSADAAVKSCSAGVCGTQWTWGRYDGLTGVGQDMAALVVMQGLLQVGGTKGFESLGDGGAGVGSTATGTGGSGGASGTGTSSGAGATSSKKSGAEKVVLGSTILLGVVAMVFVGWL